MRPAVALACLGLFACRRPTPPWSIDAPDPITRRVLVSGAVVGGPGRYDSHAWLGIPFAEPPVGELRFRSPRPPAHWTGDRATLAFGPACPQFASAVGGVRGAAPGEVVGSEDCLSLNVWAPQFPPGAVPQGTQRLPVMLWVHGGGNSIGAASFYDGGHLAASQRVIVVATQYRLGPLGWFRHRALRSESADPLEQSGNFGTLDLIRALEWVRDNASAFGGDPNNVTIFGESAGGANVYSLLLAPAAKGLFHRAIVESGGLSRVTNVEAEAFADDPFPGHRNSSSEVLARLLGDRVKAATLDDPSLRALLRSRTAAQLLLAYDTPPRLGMIDMPLVFRDGALLPSGDWVEQLAQPQGWNRVPVILGSNRDEAKLFLFLDPHRIHWRLGLIPHFVDEPRYQGTAEALSRMWKATAVDAPAAAMRRSGAAQVFAYRFDWRGEPSLLGADLAQMVGAAHGLEVPFVFGHFDLGPLARPLFSESDPAPRLALSEAMMRYWAGFARAGWPAADGLPAWSAWDDSAPGAPKFLALDSPLTRAQMSAATETRQAIIADVDRDERLPSQRDKCRVFHDMAGWTHGFTQAEYPRTGANGCADFPFDRYPWPDAPP